MMNALNAEMTLRHVDGQLVYFTCGLEEGEENQNSHLQLTYMLQVAEKNKTTSKKERRHGSSALSRTPQAHPCESHSRR
jgi:16S rRNA C967 or C1407 C5-methylase (RsmB/RsmF family)